MNTSHDALQASFEAGAAADSPSQAAKTGAAPDQAGGVQVQGTSSALHAAAVPAPGSPAAQAQPYVSGLTLEQQPVQQLSLPTPASSHQAAAPTLIPAPFQQPTLPTPTSSHQAAAPTPIHGGTGLLVRRSLSVQLRRPEEPLHPRYSQVVMYEP